MAQATHLLNIVIRVMDKASAPLKGVESNLKKVEKAATGMNKKFLGMGLGLTFFMFGVKMQLDRMLRSMFNIFKEAEGETGVLIQKFHLMRANLAAISIAFFDAFAQSALFDFIISAITRVVNWFLNLTDTTREWLSTSLFVFSGLIFGLSMIGQALLAIFVLSGAPLLTTFLVISFALGLLVIEFVGSVGDMKDVWEDFLGIWADPDLTIFDKIKLSFIDLGRLLLDIAPIILGTAGAIWGGIVGGPIGALLGGTLGATAGKGLELTFGAGLDKLREKTLISAKTDDLSSIGGIPENATPKEMLALLDLMDSLPANISDSLARTPVPLLDNPEGLTIKPIGDSLKVSNETDQKKLDKMEEQRLATKAESEKEVASIETMATNLFNIASEQNLNIVEVVRRLESLADTILSSSTTS